MIRIDGFDLILSRKPDSWDGLFELYGKGDVPKDFMGPADRKQPPQRRDPFKGWPFKRRKNERLAAQHQRREPHHPRRPRC